MICQSVIRVSGLLVTLLTGCGLGGMENGFRVFDYRTAKTVAKVRSGPSYREMVVDQSFEHCFFTLTRDGDSLIFTEWDENGTVVKRYRHPLLEPVWIDNNWFSISPDRTRIAYWQDKQRVLRVRKMDGSIDEIVFISAGKEDIPRLELLAWRDNSRVVLAFQLKIDGFRYMDICLISVDGTVRKARSQFGFSPALRMSPNHRYVCGVIPPFHVPYPDWEKGAEIMVFDINTMKEHLRVPAVSTRNSIMELGWTSDSASLYFTGGAGGGHKNPYMFDLANRTTTPVKARVSSVLLGHHGATLGFASNSNALIFDYSNGRVIRGGHCNGAMVGIQGTTRYVIGE